MKTPEDYGIKNYTWNNGKLDVDGDVGLDNKGLTELPFKFGEVKGSFSCRDNRLTSLQGAPERAIWGVNCDYNPATPLQLIKSLFVNGELPNKYRELADKIDPQWETIFSLERENIPDDSDGLLNILEDLAK